MSARRAGGPGPFVTHIAESLPGGGHRITTSRRHRKGLPPHEIERLSELTRGRPTQRTAFAHVLAPRRLGWWIAVLFAIGATHFLMASLASALPEAWSAVAPKVLPHARTLGWCYFIGSLFFTTAAWLQWLEALNHDLTMATPNGSPRWRWFGWRPRNLGYLASAIQLVGTLLFNLNTADALVPGLDWRAQDWLVWTPDMLGSLCFLAASCLAFAELSHGTASCSPSSVSWWVVVVNLAGSVAFQLSALAAVVGPHPAQGRVLVSTLLTAAGALCFLIGAYLLVPELFDTE